MENEEWFVVFCFEFGDGEIEEVVDVVVLELFYE